MIALILILILQSGDGDDEGSGGALDTLPPGGTLETLPPGGTLETLPSATTTTSPDITTTSTTAATTGSPASPPSPVTPQDFRDVFGPLLGEDEVDGAFQALQEWPNVTTFDRLPPLEGPGLTFERAGIFNITADDETFERWDDAGIPHGVDVRDYVGFAGILDEEILPDADIVRQLGLVASDGDDVPPDLGAGHLGSSGVYFFSEALDPEDFGNGWVPATSFDVQDGFRQVETGASGFVEYGSRIFAVLVPADEVGDSILSGLIFGRLTEGEPENDQQPATTRTVTVVPDPFGGDIPPLPPIDPGRFDVSGTINGEEAEVEPGDDDITDLTFEELLVKLALKNGCGINNHFWVFAAAATDVEYTLTVTDTETGSSRTYESVLDAPAPAIVDTDAFATCP